MTDYTDLQKAAEYAAQDTIKFADESEEMRALQQFHEEVDPETVLALIAENERVKARLCMCRDCGGRGEIYSGHSSYQGYNQPPEPDMDMCGTCGGDGFLGPLEDFEALAAERDHLKAENEALRRERDARHPFKPFHEPAIGFTGCVICGVYTDHGGLPCPKTRAAAIALSMENQRLTPVEPLRVPHPLDAALGQGEQS